MKRLFAIVTALLLLASAFGMLSFAEEAESNVERVLTYAESSAHSPGKWLNSFDEDGNCTGTDYVIFNAAADLAGFGFPEIYGGRTENEQEAEVRFEVFKWDTDAEKTLASTPVFSEERLFDQDIKEPEFTFESPLPKGQYLLKITQLTAGDASSFPSHYAVLPQTDLLYGDGRLLFENVSFCFWGNFVKTDGVTEYFLNLEGNDTQIDIQPAKTLIKRSGDVPHEIIEYGILTPVIPDGQVLYSICLLNSPTWNNTNGDSDVEVAVYKWKGDYDSTFEGRELFTTELLDHADNSNLVVEFGTTMRYGSRYLIVLTQSNSGKIGYWQGEDGAPDGWEFYEGGEEVDYTPAMKIAYGLVGDLGPEPTEEPTKEPTEKPATPAPTEAPEPTDEPAVTDKPATEAPKPTDVPATQAPATEKPAEKSGNSIVPIIIIIVCAVVVISSVTVIILSKKKKK